MMNRTMKIIFTLSVVLNVMLIGALGGFFYKRMTHMPHHDPALRESLDPQTRHLMARQFRAHKEEIGENIKAMRVVRQDIMTVMSAEEFDRAAYDQAVARLVQGQDTRMKHQAMMIGDIAGDLSVEERRKLAGLLLARGEGHPDKPRPRERMQELRTEGAK